MRRRTTRVRATKFSRIADVALDRGVDVRVSRGGSRGEG